jgi:hypothetical protein
MKKNIFLAIALAAMSLTVVQQVQAQTQQQQRELEQIARRSINGISPQDRQRVIQIMTDVYAAQGMSRQQAASLAEMAANSMFSDATNETTPEQQRQFAEQEQRLRDFEQGQQQRPPNNTWPPARTFARYGRAIQKPSVSFDGNFEVNGEELTITINHPNWDRFQDFTQAEITAICRVFEAEFGTAYPAGTYNEGKIWREDVIKGSPALLYRQDPKRRNTADTSYSIVLEIKPLSSAGKILGIQIVMKPEVNHSAQ